MKALIASALAACLLTLPLTSHAQHRAGGMSPIIASMGPRGVEIARLHSGSYVLAAPVILGGFTPGTSVSSAGMPDPYTPPDGTWNVTGSVSASSRLSAGADIFITNAVAPDLIWGDGANLRGRDGAGNTMFTAHDLGTTGALSISGNEIRTNADGNSFFFKDPAGNTLLTVVDGGTVGDAQVTRNVIAGADGVFYSTSGTTFLGSVSTPLVNIRSTGGVAVNGGTPIAKVLSFTAVLDFPDTAAGAISDLTVTATGAALGDVVTLGVPAGSVAATSSYFGWVSAADVVTIRHSPNGAAANPASGTFRVQVTKF